MKPTTLSTTDNLSSPPPINEATAPPDPVLRCPRCDYNLAGLPEDRCPECGEVFDRQKLIAWLTRPNQPILYGQQSNIDLLSTLPLSLFRPRRIGRDLASRCDPLKIGLYSLAAKLLAAAIAFPAAWLAFKPDQIGSCLVICLTIVCMAKTAESLLGALLARFLQPRNPIPRRFQYRFWRNLCRCFAFHLPISAAFVVAVGSQAPLLPPMLLGLSISILWWWYNLSLAISTRAVFSGKIAMAILLIPVVGIAVTAVGFLLCTMGIGWLVLRHV